MSNANSSPENMMNNICTQLHTYIDEKYNDIFAIYTHNITSDISADDFTERYGAISHTIEAHFKSITLDEAPSKRWYIHYSLHFKPGGTNQTSYTVIVYDNYGDTYTFQWMHNAL